MSIDNNTACEKDIAELNRCNDALFNTFLSRVDPKKKETYEVTFSDEELIELYKGKWQLDFVKDTIGLLSSTNISFCRSGAMSPVDDNLHEILDEDESEDSNGSIVVIWGLFASAFRHENCTGFTLNDSVVEYLYKVYCKRLHGANKESFFPKYVNVNKKVALLYQFLYVRGILEVSGETKSRELFLTVSASEMRKVLHLRQDEEVDEMDLNSTVKYLSVQINRMTSLRYKFAVRREKGKIWFCFSDFVFLT